MLHEIDIHLEWEGPHTFTAARSMRGDSDWGVYQIYGLHQVYGTDNAPLYWQSGAAILWRPAIAGGLVGLWGGPQTNERLSRAVRGRNAPDDATWCRHIDLAERLLIHVHRPAWNAQKGIQKVDRDLQQVHVFNWGAHRSLLPEVSGARWSSRLHSTPNWHVFESAEPWQARKIGNSELQLQDVPPPEADWGKLQNFALTFEGYEECGSTEKCAEIANERRNSTLSELRTCLFFEQRRWRHFGDTPDDETMDYLRRVVLKIRQKVTDREVA